MAVTLVGYKIPRLVVLPEDATDAFTVQVCPLAGVTVNPTRQVLKHGGINIVYCRSNGRLGITELQHGQRFAAVAVIACMLNR